MSQMSPEIQILLDSVRWRIDHCSVPFEIISFDESVLFTLAARHNLLPWFLPYAKAFSIGSEALIERVVAHLLVAGMRHQLQTLELLKLSSLLNEKGVQHAILKGVTIEKQFYKGFVDSRYSDDIDILIEPRSVRLVSETFMAAGYQQREPRDIGKFASFIERYEHWFRWRDIGFRKKTMGMEHIDLHWRIADSFTIPVKTRVLLAKVESVSVNGEQVASLPFTLLFIYVCVHGYLDYFFRLRYLVDVYTAMQQPEFDLKEVLEAAEKWGVKDKVLESIATAERFFSVPRDAQISGQTDAEQRYSELVYQRFVKANGFPKRSHPNHGEWTAKDKWRHLRNQIKFRSDRSWVLAPLLARCKYNDEMVAGWSPKRSALIWFPVAWFKRLLTSL